MSTSTQPVLYVIACGAPAARDVGRLVDLAQRDGWDVCVVATPDGAKWVDAPAVAAQTGHPVRVHYKDPDAPDVLPPADAMAVAPATCNTVNKWAAGISDTLALGLLVEAVGRRLPLVAMPFTNWEQAAHPAFGRSVAELRSWGVTVLFDRGYDFPEPASVDHAVDQFPWHRVLEALADRRPAVETVPPPGHA